MMEQTKLFSPVKKITSLIKPEEGTHIWQFSRVGGVNRVSLVSGEDIASLSNLDQKLWTALSCPVHGLEIDARTLELIDTDHDERIRVPEILAAAAWITSLINNPDDLLAENKSLPLSAINDQTEEGKVLLASAKQILVSLGKPGQAEITVEETSDIAAIFADTKFNGDGIITEDSTEDAGLKKLISDIINCKGSVVDRSGKPGITSDHIHEFYQDCEDYSAWYKKAEEQASEILPFGDATREALDALQAVKSKINDYFLRCRLAEYDPASIESLNILTPGYEAIRAKDLSDCADEIASFPIAKMNLEKILPLGEAINPSWERALREFRQLVVVPVFADKSHLTLEEWDSLPPKFDAYQQWMSEKKGANVEPMGVAVIREYLEHSHKEELLSLITQDMALESEANNIIRVDKLVRYYCDLYTLLKNYVNFSDFYSPDSKAIFQAGKLYIDQRCCDLCLKVHDMPRHNNMAGASGICLVYCDCVSRLRNERMTIVAALTDGDIDNIAVGRNALFYDRQNGDWDATIIKIIDNPISIRQAFWSPYKKLSKFISKQIEKAASSREQAIDAAAATHVEKSVTKADTGITKAIQSKSDIPPVAAAPAAAAPAQAFDIGKFVGIFAAISLALGAIGSVVISILAGFFKLRFWEMPLAFLGIILAISTPSMILAYLKLRKRDLAPVLDANGWAINARVTINIIFGRTLTHLASLPANSRVNLMDPFSKKKKPALPIIIVTLVIIGVVAFLIWRYGLPVSWRIF